MLSSNTIRASAARAAAVAYVAMLTLVTGCDHEDDSVPVQMSAPLVDLAAPAGYRAAETTYAVPGSNVSRTLPLSIWYATSDTMGEGAVFVPFLFEDPLSLVDATVRPPSRRRKAPLMVYSHGFLGFGGNIHTVARQFVQNGWIVVAPEHVGNSWVAATQTLAKSFPIVRADDLRATIDYIENLPPTDPLYGRVDTSRVLVMGHSYGAQTAWIAGGASIDPDLVTTYCAGTCTAEDLAVFAAFTPDPRVAAVVPLDGALGSDLAYDTGFGAMTAPVLFLSGSASGDGTSTYERAALADVTWVELVGGCHESFTGTLACSTLALSESFTIAATYAIAFGIRHVLGSDDGDVVGILDGTLQVSDRVNFARNY